MPMTFTDEVVRDYLERSPDLDATGTAEEKRERLAEYMDERWKDHVAAWEVRTGRPWDTMKPEEEAALIEHQPATGRNPGVLSRLAQ